MADLNITNNTVSSRFELQLNGAMSVLDYRIEGTTIHLLYVQVPEAQQGRGIASTLSQAALEFARASGLKVVPKCPFIAEFVRRHPELLQPNT
jgi:predicted GNAT family acetyltransferase